MVAVTPDLLRLLALPVFVAVAIADVRSRRVPRAVWPPLAVLGLIALVWELTRQRDVGGFVWQLYLIRVALSLGLVMPLAWIFWWLGGFGRADAKGLAVLAVLYPTFPQYQVAGYALPVVATEVGVFSLTILTNAVLIGLIYPLALGAINALQGRLHPAIFVARPVRWDTVTDRHGQLLESPDGFTRQGLDLDALRMYLAWRDCSLADLRSEPARHRDPASLPDDPAPPGDGRITDGGEPAQTEADRWGAAAFLGDVREAYGTTPATLRDGLEVLTTREYVWVSPGIPFLVPLTMGLIIALTYGDLLFGVLAPILP